MASPHPAPSLWAGQVVYSRDALRLGRIEEVRGEGFLISRPPGQLDCWLRRDAVARVTEGGVVYLTVVQSALESGMSLPPADGPVGRDGLAESRWRPGRRQSKQPLS